MSKKLTFMAGEMWRLIKRHKFYFLAPIVIILTLLIVLIYWIGPDALTSFLYAGI